jgi:predicted nuclease of predicted toxin-antitoxin system
VRLLIDANLSPKVAAALRKAGLESVHVGDVGLLTAPDRAILDYAAADALVMSLLTTISASSWPPPAVRRDPRSCYSAN